jgi:hypothetical protein
MLKDCAKRKKERKKVVPQPGLEPGTLAFSV